MELARVNLAPRFSDKYEVVNIVSQTIIEIKDERGNISRIHVKDAKPYHEAVDEVTEEKEAKNNRTNPERLATVDDQSARAIPTLGRGSPLISKTDPKTISVYERLPPQLIRKMDDEILKVRDSTEHSEDEVIEQINKFLTPSIPHGPAVARQKSKDRGLWQVTIDKKPVLPPAKIRFKSLQLNAEQQNVSKVPAVPETTNMNSHPEIISAVSSLKEFMLNMPTWIPFANNEVILSTTVNSPIRPDISRFGCTTT